MGRMKAIRLIAVLSAIALLVGACGGASKNQAGGGKQLANAPGFDGKTIRVGDLTPLTGPAAVIGKQLAAGQDVYWKAVNAEKGGIAGKYPVQLVTEDTAYQTNVAVQQYNKDKASVTLFSQVMGTPTVLALLPLLKDDKIVASPASQDAFWVHEQQLMPIIEPYQIDAINAMSYYWNEAGGKGKTIGVILQNDVYGQAGLEGVQYAAQKLGFEVKAVARFNFGDQDFTAQVTQLKNAGAQAVFAVAQPTEFGKILGTAAKLSYAPQWIAQSPAYTDALVKTALKPYMESNVWVAAVGPEWGDMSVPGMSDLINRVNKYAPSQEPNYYFSFGYFQAMAVDQVLAKAVSLGNLSRDGVIKAMDSLKALTFDGYIGDYQYGTPDQRNPGRLTTVFKVNSAKPFGLQSVKQNFTTPEAQAFVFKVGS